MKMRKKLIIFCTFVSMALIPLFAQSDESIMLENVVVTGTRHETDVRHLPMTVTTLSHEKLSEHHRSSILSTLNEQVPGLFTTSRGSFQWCGWGLYHAWSRGEQSECRCVGTD